MRNLSLVSLVQAAKPASDPCGWKAVVHQLLSQLLAAAEIRVSKVPDKMNSFMQDYEGLGELGVCSTNAGEARLKEGWSEKHDIAGSGVPRQVNIRQEHLGPDRAPVDLEILSHSLTGGYILGITSSASIINGGPDIAAICQSGVLQDRGETRDSGIS